MIKTPNSLTIARVPKKRNLSGSRENYLEAAAFVARTLADVNRLRILLCIHAGKKSVSGIVEELNLRSRRPAWRRSTPRLSGAAIA